MARVLYVKESRVRGYVSVGITTDGGSVFYTVGKITYSEIGSPSRGTVLDDAVLSVLREEDEAFRAVRRALSILSYGDNSKRALEAKLMRAGFSHSSVELAIRECEGHGYINEDAQLERKIEVLANEKLMGPHYIRAKLARAGYSVGNINSALSRMTDNGDVDFGASFDKLLQKKEIADDEGKRALAYKYGYKR